MENRAPYDFNRVTKLNPRQNGRNYAGDKETVGSMQFVAALPKGHYSGKRFASVITVRFYMGRSRNASTVYASIWAQSRDGKTHLAGHGSAGGYGYHKESAALEEAMHSAGVTLDAHFGGCGDRAAQCAIEALARKLGYRSGNII